MTEEEINKYSNLIYSVSHKFEAYKNKEDLFQAGIIGLLMAYQNYNTDYDTKFSTYAYKYIYGEMSKLVREDKNIKLGRNIIKLKNLIEKTKNILSQKLCHEPSLEEISNYLEIPYDTLCEALMYHSTTSIDVPLNSEGKELTYHDIISDNNMDIDTLVALKEELQTLSPIERKIINKRYLENLSQSEVAKELGLTQVKISREESKIKQKIKKSLVA